MNFCLQFAAMNHVDLLVRNFQPKSTQINNFNVKNVPVLDKKYAAGNFFGSNMDAGSCGKRSLR